MSQKSDQKQLRYVVQGLFIIYETYLKGEKTRMTSTAASVSHWLNYACKSRKLYLRKGPLVNLTQENEVYILQYIYMTFDYFYSQTTGAHLIYRNIHVEPLCIYCTTLVCTYRTCSSKKSITCLLCSLALQAE